MEKALEILKEFKIQIETCPDDCWFELEQVNEAISELEEAMKPKTCDGCEYEDVYHDECEVCKNNFEYFDFFKQKQKLNFTPSHRPNHDSIDPSLFDRLLKINFPQPKDNA